MPTVQDYLKYVNLQMAAEAFLVDGLGNPLTGTDYVEALESGNNHASRFTITQAENFADQWEVVDQRANTPTGFSGTLFRNRANPNDLVLSFRSTEFIDDAARDNEATNKLEISDFGFAFGQLSDMESWYAELSQQGGPLSGKQFAVTGYSLGGHLATAFNLMHPGAATEVVTFNGAGIGRIGDGSLIDTYLKLPQMVQRFQELRAHAAVSDLQGKFTTPEALSAYRAIQAAILANGGEVDASILGWTVPDDPDYTLSVQAKVEFKLLADALGAAVKVAAEAVRAPSLSSGPDANGVTTSPKSVDAADIAADSLDYQIAVRLVAEEFGAAPRSIFGGLLNTFFGKSMGSGSEQIRNQFDLVGTEMDGTIAAAMVANSQWHYGQNVKLFIESQPGYRGSAPSAAAVTSFRALGFKLLVDGYNQNDFGDTHSLVLIVDSLNVQNALLQLVPEGRRAAASATLITLLQQASWRKAEIVIGTDGKAEGDVLEQVVNALADYFLGPQKKEAQLDGSPLGNTWAITDASFTASDGQTYTGREAFYARLQAITESRAYQQLAGALRLEAAGGSLAARARNEFGAFAALWSLSPFVLSGDEAMLQQHLEATWNNTAGLFDAWDADRDAHLAGHEGHDDAITDAWLADRAELLSRKVWFNTQNRDPNNPDNLLAEESPSLEFGVQTHRYLTDSTLFIDKASDYTIAQGFNPDAPYSGIHHYYFGDDQKDTHTGGGVEDHLYGMAGDDTLSGQGGNDYLEGGLGDDVLNGDAGDDRLLGGAGADKLYGGDDPDTLEGGADADELYGDAGNDRLIGGQGDDKLAGGLGDDLYVWKSGDGKDTIVETREADGRILGRIRIDGNERPLIVGGAFIAAAGQSNTWIDPATGLTLTHNSPWTLVTTDGSSIQLGETFDDFQSGDFGIRKVDAAAEVTYGAGITGDIIPTDIDASKSGIQAAGDAYGNPVGEAAPYADILRGTGGNDHILAGESNDDVDGGAGDDRIEGGVGNDYLWGAAGKDLLEGGEGRDILAGGEGDDRLFADVQGDLTEVIQAGNLGVGSGLKGDWLSGNAGDDILVGGDGDDVLSGGGGRDLLIGGAGKDYLLGDSDYTPQVFYDGGHSFSVAGITRTHTDGSTFDWTVTEGADETLFWPVVGPEEPADGAGDVIFAGAGDDRVWGGAGDDVVYGEDGDDILQGQDGSDLLFGGAGNDQISGDASYLDESRHGNDLIDGGDGDDYLDGGAGDDTIYGGSGVDELYGDSYWSQAAGRDFLDGGAGDDFLWGGEGDDVLDGGEDNDLLVGGGGGDRILGGVGNDQIAGDYGDGAADGGNDVIDAGAGDDRVIGEGGDDLILAGDGNDLVDGGRGNDTLHGGAGNDQLQAGEGDDVLDGGEGSDTLFGEAGEDTIRGGAGNDYLIGGAGADLLDGGDGNDVYYYSRGEGRDRIVDSGGTDWLVFNDIFWGEVKLGVGSLKLSVPDGEIHLDDFDADNPYAPGGIEYFQFADGTVMSKSQLINAIGMTPTGTPDDDQLSGTALADTIRALGGDDIVDARAGDDTVYADAGADEVLAGDGNDTVYGGDDDDRLYGGAGNDWLYGEAGDDLLAGGAGNDRLAGGGGADSYLFALGDGQDRVIDGEGANRIVLGTGLTLATTVFSRVGDDLVVAVKGGNDRLTVQDWFAATGGEFELTLGDGTRLDRAGVEAAMPRNLAPVANDDVARVVEDALTIATGNALANDDDPEGRSLRVTNPGSYAGSYGSLALSASGDYSYTLANGSAAVQSLAAGQTVSERFAYTVSDDDPAAPMAASAEIVVEVVGSNDLPQLGADHALTTEDAAPIGGNLLANDRDVDAGTTLAVATPGTQTGSYGVLDLAADGGWTYALANASPAVQSLAAGQRVQERFAFAVGDGVARVDGALAIDIDGANDAPVLLQPLADQQAAANSSWSWQLPAGSFADVDAGDSLSYGATLADGSALPSWLAFDAASQSFSGRVPKSTTGSVELRVQASDRAGATAADLFTLSFDAAAGGGGGGGGNDGGNGGGNSAHGNAGVGNGVDGPPPGHVTDFNDGPDSGPGEPGAQGGEGYRPPRLADLSRVDLRIDAPGEHASARGRTRAASRSSAAAGAADNGQRAAGGAAPANAGLAGGFAAAGALSLAADAVGAITVSGSAADGGSAGLGARAAASAPGQAYLDPALVAAFDAASTDAAAPRSADDEAALRRRWAELDRVFGELLADDSHPAFVADGAAPRGLAVGAWAVADSPAAGNDPLALTIAPGIALGRFNGLREGLQQLG